MAFSLIFSKKRTFEEQKMHVTGTTDLGEHVVNSVCGKIFVAGTKRRDFEAEWGWGVEIEPVG